MRESLNGSYATTALHAMTIYDRQHSGISLSCNVPRFRTRTITALIMSQETGITCERIVRYVRRDCCRCYISGECVPSKGFRFRESDAGWGAGESVNAKPVALRRSVTGIGATLFEHGRSLLSATCPLEFLGLPS